MKYLINTIWIVVIALFSYSLIYNSPNFFIAKLGDFSSFIEISIAINFAFSGLPNFKNKLFEYFNEWASKNFKETQSKIKTIEDLNARDKKNNSDSMINALAVSIANAKRGIEKQVISAFSRAQTFSKIAGCVGIILLFLIGMGVDIERASCFYIVFLIFPIPCYIVQCLWINQTTTKKKKTEIETQNKFLMDLYDAHHRTIQTSKSDISAKARKNN